MIAIVLQYSYLLIRLHIHKLHIQIKEKHENLKYEKEEENLV